MKLWCSLFFFLMIRRPPRSTLDRSSAASDVYKRQTLYYARAIVKPQIGHVNRPYDGFFAWKNVQLRRWRKLSQVWSYRQVQHWQAVAKTLVGTLTMGSAGRPVGTALSRVGSTATAPVGQGEGQASWWTKRAGEPVSSLFIVTLTDVSQTNLQPCLQNEDRSVTVGD